MSSLKKYFRKWRGNEKCPPRKPISKIIWSWVGAFVGIYLISSFNNLLNIGGVNSLFLIGSFGASAVLVYGAPMAEFSQPRNLLIGHVVSAFVGVTIFQFISNDHYIPRACAFAVATAIALMHLTRSLHPPGGATALIAIIGQQRIHQLGFWYVLSPVLTGAVILLIVALVINNLSANPQRHYPKYWF